MVKLIQALEKRSGLSIWIFDKAEDMPKYAQGFPTMEREGITEYHSPSAKDFWDWLWEDDKGEKMSENITNGKQLLTIKEKQNETINIIIFICDPCKLHNA